MLAKPAVIFFGVTANEKDSRTILDILYIVITFPALFLIQLSQDVLTAFFSGPNTLRSNGCILCVQCGGNVRRTIPLSLQKSMFFNATCEL